MLPNRDIRRLIIDDLMDRCCSQINELRGTRSVYVARMRSDAGCYIGRDATNCFDLIVVRFQPAMSVESARDQTVSLVVSLLVAGRYDELSRLDGGERLGAQELASAVAEYGRTLVPPPASRQPPDFFRITGTPTEAWSVVAPLYTQEEGLSDLSLELTLTRDPQALPYGYRIAIDNLHVL